MRNVQSFAAKSIDLQAEREGAAVARLEYYTGARQESGGLLPPPRRVRFSPKRAADHFEALFARPAAVAAPVIIPPTWADLERRARDRIDREADKILAARLRGLPADQARHALMLARKERAAARGTMIAA